jgi:hypothetical protein
MKDHRAMTPRATRARDDPRTSSELAVAAASAFAIDASVPACVDTSPMDDDQERRRDSCFVATEQSWRTAWRARSLLSWTNTSSAINASWSDEALLL